MHNVRKGVFQELYVKINSVLLKKQAQNHKGTQPTSKKTIPWWSKTEYKTKPPPKPAHWTLISTDPDDSICPHQEPSRNPAQPGPYLEAAEQTHASQLFRSRTQYYSLPAFQNLPLRHLRKPEVRRSLLECFFSPRTKYSTSEKQPE